MLPTIPKVYNALNAALVDPEVSLDDIGKIVEQDVAISAKILQLVNSSFFGIVANITSIRQATAFLGVDLLRNLALSTELMREFKCVDIPSGFSIQV